MAILVVGVVLAARGDVIWQTYDGVTTGPEILHVSRTTGYGGDRKAGWFATGGSPYQLENVIMNLTRDQGNSSDLAVSVWTDVGGKPGSNVGSLVGPSSIASSEFGDYAFVAPGIRLEPLSKYWLVMEPSLSTLSYFRFGTSRDDLGYLSAPIHAATGTYWENWQVETEFYSPAFIVNASVIPEPGVLGVGVSGAVTLWLFGGLGRRWFRG